MSDIIIAGNTYTEVPKIIIPKSGGGMSEFYEMDTPLSWLGAGAELFAGEFYRKVDVLKNTLFNGWTPSSTAKAIVASQTLSPKKFTATDLDKWAYYIIWECGVDLEYTGSPTNTARPLFSRCYMVQELIRRSGSWADISNGVCETLAAQSAYTSTFMRYYNNNSTLTYTYAASYGFYNSATSPIIGSTSALSTAITPKTPTLSARTSTTYMSTANAGLVDQDNSKWWIIGAGVYRAKRNTFFDGVYRATTNLINKAAPAIPTT